MTLINFINPIHHEGVNFTVRVGTKWADQLSVDQIVQLDLPIGTGRAWVRMIVVCKLQDIPDFVYDLQHDPNSKTEADLIRSLNTAYKPFGKLPYPKQCTKVVSCIGYELISWHLIAYQFE